MNLLRYTTDTVLLILITDVIWLSPFVLCLFYFAGKALERGERYGICSQSCARARVFTYIHTYVHTYICIYIYIILLMSVTDIVVICFFCCAPSSVPSGATSGADFSNHFLFLAFFA